MTNPTTNPLYEAMAKALEPFAEAASAVEFEEPNREDDEVYDTVGRVYQHGGFERTPRSVDLTHGHFRAARSALADYRAMRGTTGAIDLEQMAGKLTDEIWVSHCAESLNKLRLREKLLSAFREIAAGQKAKDVATARSAKENFEDPVANIACDHIVAAIERGE
jgi:hypothetical protein